MQKKFNTSQTVAIVAVFAALNVVTDSLASLPEIPSGVWYSWNFLIVPLTGIILGPLLGFAATFIGVMIGHYIYFIDAYEFLFTVGAPLGAAVSALVYKGKWKPVLVYYVALFAGYFLTPVAWQLPLWGMWDTYLAFAVLVAAIFLIKKGLWKHEARTSLPKKWIVGLTGAISTSITVFAVYTALQPRLLDITIILIFAELAAWIFFMITFFIIHDAVSISTRTLFILSVAAFVGLEADVLFRIFVFIPGQTYSLFYGFDVETLQLIWGGGAVITPIKVALSTVATVVIGHPLIKTLKKAGFLFRH
ncbi:MAG: hypothetical protein ACE5KD_03295 [Candidatus Bathyarchaeia archaeon]